MTTPQTPDYEQEAEKFMSLHLFAPEEAKASVVAYLKRVRAAARAEALLNVIHLLAPDGEPGSEHEREALEIIADWHTKAIDAGEHSVPPISQEAP